MIKGDACYAVGEECLDPLVHSTVLACLLLFCNQFISLYFVEGFVEIKPGYKDQLMLLENILDLLEQVDGLTVHAVESSKSSLFGC